MIESIWELIICSDHVLDVFLFGKFIHQRTSGKFGRESYAAESNSPWLNELEKLWGSSITCLGFFVHYRFSERFQNKTEPLNRQVQFMISMHSECFNLPQSFVLPCSVLFCPVVFVLSRHMVSSVICLLSPSPSDVGVCVWSSCRCSWATLRSETTKVAPVSRCFSCLQKIENRL